MFTDPFAVEKFKELVREFGVKTVVETGTYKADSTVKIAEIVPYTVSIEVVREHFEESRQRFLQLGYRLEYIEDNYVRLRRDKHKVVLYCGNSPEVIAKVVGLLDEPILFYLDAHWLDYWPLKDEIRAIKPRPNSLIVIHDCRVPGKDFGYDIWTSGVNEYKTFKDDLAYVNPNYSIFYNEKAAGSYRGILYAVPSREGIMAKQDSLKILVVSTMIFPVSPENRYAGIETLVRLISSELNRRGYLVSVAAPQGSRFPSGIEHINTGGCGDFIESERKAYWGYSHRLKDFDAILEMSHSHWCMMENDLPALAFIWHDPLIMKPQEPSYNVCALSQWQANRFRQVYGYEARVLDPHCVDRPPLPAVRKGQRFLFIGRLNPDKGVREAVRICRELGVGLDIIGGLGRGDSPEFLHWVEANSDGKKIVYQGEVDDNTKFGFLRSARALIYPINYPAGQGEAHSHKMAEALATGCPCVSYDVGAFAEVIEHGITGFLAQDEEEFKEYMLKVGTFLSSVVRHRAIKRWSVEATVDRIIPVLEAVAKGERWGQTSKQLFEGTLVLKPEKITLVKSEPVIPLERPQALTGPVIIRPSAPSAAGYVKYELKEFPRQIRLDTINACNAKCIPCHINFQTRPHGQMGVEMIRKVLSELKSWPKPPEEIVPVNFGELFLLKNWYEILKLIEDSLPQTRIALPTNGSLLDDDAVRKLAPIRTLKWLNFSINAFFKETYQQFTDLGPEVIDRIKRATELIRSLRPDIVTCASMIFDTGFQTEMERDLFIQFWQPLVSVVSINPAAYCNSPLKSPIIPVKTACRSIFDGLTVLYDGKVVTNCCFDCSGTLEVGNVSTLPLLLIWRGQKLRELCELHNNGRREEIELCQNCTFA